MFSAAAVGLVLTFQSFKSCFMALSPCLTDCSEDTL